MLSSTREKHSYENGLFFDKILHDHQIDQKENVESKDFVDMLLSSSQVDNYNYTLDDNKIKGIINVILILPHVDYILILF
jgi:hypothetical protein